MDSSRLLLLLVPIVCGCGGAAATPAVTAPPASGVHAVVLPGGPGEVRMDFIAYDAAARRLWVPAGNTGRVDVIDVETGGVRAIEGFATAEIEAHGGRRVVGPSSVAVGDGVVYVGNRGDRGICAIDPTAMRVTGCATVTSKPDALALVPEAHQLWVTTPDEKTITVLAVDGTAAPVPAGTITLEGEPECSALDHARGVFYTNLEDLDRTVAIDVASHAVTATWQPGCGEAGPRGLALDAERGFLFVACTDHVATLDVAHGGAVLATLPTGARLDDVTYAPDRAMLYVASGADATLRFVHVDAHGGLTVVASVATATGARNAVHDADGRAYVTDSAGGRILIVDPPRFD
jgi:DNA-binding beta-propeller fold protein YncE